MIESWDAKTLEEICDVEYGTRVVNKRDGGTIYPVYGGGGATFFMDKFNREDCFVIARFAMSEQCTRFVKGKFFLNDSGLTVKPKKSYLIEQTFLDLQLYFLNDLIYSLGKGSAQRNLDVTAFKKIIIKYPKSLREQRVIVDILERTFEAIDKAKANAIKNLKNARELFESCLQSVFENKGGDWEEVELGRIANTWGRIGWKGLTAKEYVLKGPLFLSVHSLNYGDYVDFRDAFHITQERYDESPEIMLKKNDILICKDGAGIGKLGIVPDLPSQTTINSSLLLIRCKKDIITKYLYYNLLSPSFQSIVKSRLSGATTPHLYQRDIVTFPILLPSITQQELLVQKLDALSAQTKKLETIYKQKIDDLEELKKSLLQKAFNGELNLEPVTA